MLPPFVAHNGRSGQLGRGFRKRVLYLDNDLLDERLVAAAVDRSSLDDPVLRRALDRLHRSLDGPVDDLESESRLALAVERIRTRLSGRPPQLHPPSRKAAESLRDHFDADPFGRHRLGEAAGSLGWNSTHLIRSFTEAFGLAPHQYLIARRIFEARRLLLHNHSVSDVAVAVGFHDQAHLTRHFKRHVSTTPAQFQRSQRRHHG